MFYKTLESPSSPVRCRLDAAFPWPLSLPRSVGFGECREAGLVDREQVGRSLPGSPPFYMAHVPGHRTTKYVLAPRSGPGALLMYKGVLDVGPWAPPDNLTFHLNVMLTLSLNFSKLDRPTQHSPP
jgi:hypothetical protein